ncbi:hypothetical protein [Microbacterium sp. 2MCAF23]|uniref:hypothetical protein n=1 Tax=Microbacterium sp. 2MCAF23 TaxID=3232985 RepID=UPI003F99B33B
MSAASYADCQLNDSQSPPFFSSSTEENIRSSIPLLEDAGEIAVVSNALHAERARGLLRAARPDLAARLVRADDYRFGEIPVIKAIAAALALVERRRSRVDPGSR